MNTLLLAAEPDAARTAGETLRAVPGVGAVDVVEVSEPAGRAELDPVLDRLAGRRLVVAGPPALVGDVLTRLRRRDELTGTPLAVLRVGGRSTRDDLGRPPALIGKGPRSSPGGSPEPDLMEAVRVAVAGVPVAVDLIRDDHGGVLVEAATLVPWQGRRLGMRAYVDDVRLADGEIGALSVAGAGGGRLRVTVRPARRWRADRSAEGRALQMSCAEARLAVDGRMHPRPVTRRNWWVEPGAWYRVSPR